MSNRLNKTELLGSIQNEYALLQRVLAQIPPTEMEKKGVTELWSVKDILAHLTYWQKHSLEELQHLEHGQALAFPTTLLGLNHEQALDWLNARNYAATKDLSLVAVRNEFEQSYRELLAAVQKIPGEEFEPNSRYEQLLDGEPLCEAISGNTDEHYQVHRQQIEAWQKENLC